MQTLFTIGETKAMVVAAVAVLAFLAVCWTWRGIRDKWRRLGAFGKFAAIFEHVSTDANLEGNPDPDYGLLGAAGSAAVMFSDPDGLFGVSSVTNGEFEGEGKTARLDVLAPPAITAPRVAGVNNDDDDGDGEYDYNQYANIPEDDDMVEVVVSAVCPPGKSGTVQVSTVGLDGTLWKDRGKSESVANVDVFAVSSSGTNSRMYYFEGTQASTQYHGHQINTEFSCSGNVLTNHHMITVVECVAEPITVARSQESLLLQQSGLAECFNPCGIICEEDAWFKIDLLPSGFPDDQIEWFQEGDGLVSFPAGNRGREVRIHGEECGDVTLRVQIGDLAGNCPCFHAEVVSNSVVGVSVWVVSGGTAPAISQEQFSAMMESASAVWRQAGISFRLDEYCVTNKPEMLDVGYVPTNGVPSIYDVAALNPATGVVKAYFVNRINGSANVNATTIGNSIIVSTNAAMTTLAHEIGHVLGLKDIYVLYPGVSLAVSGLVSESMSPDDWNGGTGQRHYPLGTRIESLVPKLLMYGGGGDTRADITAGDVYGLWYSNRWNAALHKWEREWQISLAPVGFFSHGANAPINGNEEMLEGETMRGTSKVLAAVLSGALAASGASHPPAADDCEEKAFNSLITFADFDHYEDIVATYKWAFELVGGDRERMTRVLIRSARDACARKYESWHNVAARSTGFLADYGTEASIPYLESVLTNDVCGVGGGAAEAYVRILGGDGRDFAFFRRNFGSGKAIPRDTGRVIYRTIGNRLKDCSPDAAVRKEYADYLLSRAECESDIVSGRELDGILVQTVSGYRDSEKRKSNLKMINSPCEGSPPSQTN